jgi:general secretion pathway protein N
MRLRAIAITAGVAYLIFLAALVPASFVAERVAAATQGRVALANAGGTLWRGSARIRLTAAGGWLDLDALEWRFDPARLLAGRIAFDVKATAQGLDAQGQVARAFSGWELRDAALRASITSLATLAPLAARWRPEGRIVATVPLWHWNDRAARGEATIEWREAALSLSEVKPIGSYRIVATADGAGAQLAVTTIEGPLQVSGKASAAPAQITFSGEARAEGPTAKALEPLLDLMGPRRPDGARAVELRIQM